MAVIVLTSKSKSSILCLMDQKKMLFSQSREQGLKKSFHWVLLSLEIRPMFFPQSQLVFWQNQVFCTEHLFVQNKFST